MRFIFKLYYIIISCDDMIMIWLIRMVELNIYFIKNYNSHNCRCSCEYNLIININLIIIKNRYY